ncbi:hypothetical protein [Rufibacter roseus]|uniref:Uncharacterized protein n=1 Tax=Rufibacter roseus TaxID=1567108 RepID=A0ABW2DK76_9BACT|nr:hypothetical protein [Rufibacter roseus]
MKRYLPLLGIFLLFFLVVSGFARAEKTQQSLTVHELFVSGSQFSDEPDNT